MNALEPDQRRPRPSYQDVRQMIDSLTLTRHSLDDPCLSKFLTLLRERYANGDAHLVALDVSENPIFSWFASRNRLPEEELLARLLTNTAIRTGLPDLVIPEPPQLPAINWQIENSFTVDGVFAQHLYQGGAYWQPSGTGESEKQLGIEVCRALFGLRYAEVSTFESGEPWTPWFKGIAWDATMALFDKRHARLFLFVITDTD